MASELKKKSQVDMQMDELRTVIDDLNGAVNELECRLAAVLLPGVEGAENKGTDREQMVPLADEIQVAVERMRDIRNTVINMRERLEL